MASTTSEASSSKFKAALCQLLVGTNKEENLANAAKSIAEAAGAGAQLVSLPEIFNGPYATGEFRKYAEEIPAKAEAADPEGNPSVTMMSKAAKEHKIFLVGGSIPEISDDKVYNTSLVFNPDGEIIAKHRKMHLFDIDVPGRMTFKESETLTAGDSMTTFDTPWAKMGLGICYDLRFVELAMLMRRAGCKVLLYPGAFNTTTGPLHWDLLQRGRAVDTQSWVLATSPARNPESTYQAYGHSQATDPWGEIVATTDHTPGIVYVDVDVAKADEVRTMIPVGHQFRSDLYTLEWNGKGEKK